MDNEYLDLDSLFDRKIITIKELIEFCDSYDWTWGDFSLEIPINEDINNFEPTNGWCKIICANYYPNNSILVLYNDKISNEKISNKIQEADMQKKLNCFKKFTKEFEYGECALDTKILIDFFNINHTPLLF